MKRHEIMYEKNKKGQSFPAFSYKVSREPQEILRVSSSLHRSSSSFSNSFFWGNPFFFQKKAGVSLGYGS